MRLLALGGALLVLTACHDGQAGAGGHAKKTVTTTRISNEDGIGGAGDSRGVGRIIDNVGAIKAEQMNGLSQELAEIDRLGGPRVTVVLVQPTSGESLEQLGWAVAGRPSGKELVLLIDPGAAAVRVEGALDPGRKAQVAAAMQQQLKLKRAGNAVEEAIEILRGTS